MYRDVSGFILFSTVRRNEQVIGRDALLGYMISGTDTTLSEVSDVDNVCVFMADALRWDHLSESVRQKGYTCKTVAASLTTHTSLPTMVSGLSPPRHGVFSWRGKIPEVPCLLDFPGYDCGYYMPGDEDTVNDGTFSVLRQESRRELDELDAPFMYFERHHGGHAPFRAAGWEGSFDEFVDEFAGDSQKHTRWYSKAIEGTVEDFRERLDTLERLGELDNTLIVFTSDHGEYLGEDGLVDHSSPLRPEGAYVPTVFVHPDLPAGESHDGIVRHVDLFPTLLSALGEDIPDYVEGVDLFETSPDRGCTFSMMNQYVRDRVVSLHDSVGVWDEDGGRVLNRTSIPRRLASLAGLLFAPGWKATHLRRSLLEFPDAASHYIRSRTQYGSPDFDWKTAESEIKEISDQEPVEQVDQIELDSDMEKQLQDLGYL